MLNYIESFLRCNELLSKEEVYLQKLLNGEKTSNKHQKLILRESCFKGIDGTRIESMAFIDTPEHKSIVEEANKRIEEGRRREAKAYNDAKYYFGR